MQKTSLCLLLALALCGVASARQLKGRDTCQFKADREYHRDEFCEEFGVEWTVIVEFNPWCEETEIIIIKEGDLWDLPCDCESKRHGHNWHWKRHHKRHFEGEVCEYKPSHAVSPRYFVHEFGFDWDLCIELNPWILEITIIRPDDDCFIPCDFHHSERKVYIWPEMEEHPCDEPSWRPRHYFEHHEEFDRRREEHFGRKHEGRDDERRGDEPTRGDGPDGPEFPPTNNSTIVVPEEIVETPVDTTEAPVDTTATPPEEVVAEPAATETEA